MTLQFTNLTTQSNCTLLHRMLGTGAAAVVACASAGDQASELPLQLLPGPLRAYSDLCQPFCQCRSASLQGACQTQERMQDSAAIPVLSRSSPVQPDHHYNCSLHTASKPTPMSSQCYAAGTARPSTSSSTPKTSGKGTVMAYHMLHQQTSSSASILRG